MDFSYTGDIQTFTVPSSGVYKLEVWGAQGAGNDSYGRGGYGGYSCGEVTLSAGDTLYVVVGGAGTWYTGRVSGEGGYNGGGSTNYSSAGNGGRGSGGGATHIALKTGLLQNLSDSLSDILIVAGGGGGTGLYAGSPKEYGIGGDGGGVKGNAGTRNLSQAGTVGLGGSQSAGGSSVDAGSFGKGGNRSSTATYGGSGGGAGFYGGGSSTNNAGAGGGSGYIGNPLLLNKHMAGYGVETSVSADTYTISVSDADSSALADNAKIGDGFARITLDAPSYTVTFNPNGGTGTMPSQTIYTGIATPLDLCTFTAPGTGYSFAGWATSSSGAVIYEDGEEVLNIATTGSSIEIFAVWEKSFAYLIGDGNGNIYTQEYDEATLTYRLSMISGASPSSINKALFQQYGFLDDVRSALLLPLSNPKIYLWKRDSQPGLSAVVDAVPYPQEIKTQIDFNRATVTGIDSIEATYSGNINVQYSYDDSTYTTAVTMAAFLAMDVDALYNGLGNTKQLYIKFILQDADSSLTQFRLAYKRRG